MQLVAIIRLLTIILGLVAPYYLHELFIARITANAQNEFALESQLKRNALATEITRRTEVMTIFDAFFRSSDSVSEADFTLFSASVPNTSDLRALCWNSTDLQSQYQYGYSQLCDYFSFAEQDRIITEESVLMQTTFTQTKSDQKGFITLFLSLQDLLGSLKETPRYADKLIIFNNSSGQYARIQRDIDEPSSFNQNRVDLTQSVPIAQIGDVEVFYILEPTRGNAIQLSMLELSVVFLSSIVILVGGLFLSHLMSIGYRVQKQVDAQTKSLQIANEKSEQLRERAEVLAEHKQRFLANMSHEIRTPMNGVLGVVQLMEEESLTEKQRDYMNVIGESGNLMISILNDILDQSKIDAGKLELQEEPCDLADLLQQMATMFKSAAITKNLALSVNIDEQLPKYMTLDPVRLKQIISNLLSNSLKFTHQGQIIVSARAMDEKVRIAVQDTGIGISEDKLEIVFAEFTQADSSTTRKYGGTGLGLSIAHRLLRLMGSELKVQSSLGNGCCFYFELAITPLNMTEAEVQAKEAERDFSNFTWPKGNTVLVVEDNAINAMFIEALLEQMGVPSVVVENGELAVQAVLDNHFDVILMDCQMPVMDGFEATRRIREIEKTQPFIIALTANALPEDRQACFEAGMDAFIGKPVYKEELIKALSQSLQVISTTDEKGN